MPIDHPQFHPDHPLAADANTTLKKVMSAEDIDQACAKMAEAINKEYADKQLLVVGILKGALLFMADLVRHLDLDVDVDFVRLSSYGRAKESSGTVTVVKDIGQNIEGKDILIVDEIVDSGRTLEFLSKRFRASGANSVKIAALLDKKSKRVVPIEPDFVGVEIPDQFLIGYGLDLEGTCRNMADVFYVERT